jgi:hypothetical protein
MKIVKYIGFYDVDNYVSENRVKSIAAVNKMNYISSAIVKAGYKVEIISPSWSANSNGLFKPREIVLSKNILLKIGPTFGANNIFSRKLRVFLSWSWLFLYLIKNVKKDENILVYHSMMAIHPICLAKKIKKFKIILELNEIYQDVSVYSSRFKKMEMKIINYSQSYILSTELLESKINDAKNYLVNYGNYNVEETLYKPSKDKIHVIYAGIIDRYKAGAFNALECAQFLDGKYMIHIIGFGNKEDVIELENKILENNNKYPCQVEFGGLKTGKEYIQAVSECHIGLSTQSPEGTYNNTSFPSKVLSYLSMGLRVVSVDVDSIKKSSIGSLLYFYKNNNGKSIAETILRIDMKQPYKSKKILRELDENFSKELKKIF